VVALAVRHRRQHGQLRSAGRLRRVRHDGHRRSPKDRRTQDEARDADLDRLRAPCRDVRIGRDDEQAHGAAVRGARPGRVVGPAIPLARVDAELDLDDEHPDRHLAVQQEDDDVGPILGRPDLRQVDRDEARLRVRREGDAERFGEKLGPERGAVLEEVDDDLVGHGDHALLAGTLTSSKQALPLPLPRPVSASRRGPLAGGAHRAGL
jgi:hypothetical protein